MNASHAILALKPLITWAHSVQAYKVQPALAAPI